MSKDDFTFPSLKETLQLADKAKGDTILLMGQTGGGKSSIANALLYLDNNMNPRDRTFPEGESLTSMTDDLNVQTGYWFGNQEKGDLTVIDTPGLLDTENRSNEFLVGTMQLIADFPINRLRIIIVTLPLSEQRANTTYQDMLLEIDQLLTPHNEPIWPHVAFVFTCSNLVSRAVNVDSRRNEWREKLITWGVDDPFICEFDYENRSSLEPLRQRFNDLQPYTPKTTEEFVAYAKTNPHASLDEKMKQNEAMMEWKQQLLERLQESEAKHEEAITKMKSYKKQTKALKDAIDREQMTIERLNHQITDLQNRPPIIVHGGCLPSSSLVWVQGENEKIKKIPINELQEGQMVATLDECGELIFSEVFFVDIISVPLAMIELCYTTKLPDGSVHSGKAKLSSDHLIFACQTQNHTLASVCESNPVTASSIRKGDLIFVQSEDLQTVLSCRVTSVGNYHSFDRATVLVRAHRLLIDSVLISSHVVNQEWGIADTAVMLFLYDHVSSSFVTSKLNKWFCRKWDSVFEPMATRVRDFF